MVSPPSRRRGLKKIGETISSTVVGVASFAEAWIENVSLMLLLHRHPVASFAEAWIENFFVSNTDLIVTSPPSRRRGLKIQNTPKDTKIWKSPPSRRRGLKIASMCVSTPPETVASFAEAWIEKCNA